jgi:hypothetical protein
MTINDFLSSISQTRIQLDYALTEKGIDPLDILQQMTMLSGLDSKYEVLQQQLFLDDNLTIESCRSKLIEATERIGLTCATIALKVNQERSLIKCPDCGKNGHGSPQCWETHPELRPNRKLPGTTSNNPSDNNKKLKQDLKKARQVIKKLGGTPPVSTQSGEKAIVVPKQAWPVKILHLKTKEPCLNDNHIIFDIDSGAEKTNLNVRWGDGDFEKILRETQNFVTDELLL